MGIVASIIGFLVLLVLLLLDSEVEDPDDSDDYYELHRVEDPNGFGR